MEGACATKKVSIKYGYRAQIMDESGLKSNRISVAQCRNTPGLPCVKGAGYVIIRSATLVKKIVKTIE